MALIKTGGGISEIRGSIGGTTFSRSRYGATARNRSIPVQPNSTRQLAARQVFASLLEAWNGLDADQRTNWNTYAANVAMTNRLGETMYLSGQNHFIRSNAIRQQALLGIIEDAPTTYNLGVVDAAMAVDGNVIWTAGEIGNFEFSLILTEGLAPYIGSTNGFMLYCSMGCNTSISYYGGPMIYIDWRGGIVAPGLQSPLEILINVLDAPWSVGQRVWFGVRWLLADGRCTEMRKLGPFTLQAPA